MAKGGARKGAGRKPQSESIKKVKPEVINAGILPLEMVLRVSRKMWAEAVDANGEITDLDKAKAAATFAEPAIRYTSPALQAIAHSGPGGGPIPLAHAAATLAQIRDMMREEAGK